MKRFACGPVVFVMCVLLVLMSGLFAKGLVAAEECGLCTSDQATGTCTDECKQWKIRAGTGVQKWCLGTLWTDRTSQRTKEGKEKQIYTFKKECKCSNVCERYEREENFEYYKVI